MGGCFGVEARSKERDEIPLTVFSKVFQRDITPEWSSAEGAGVGRFGSAGEIRFHESFIRESAASFWGIPQ